MRLAALAFLAALLLPAAAGAHAGSDSFLSLGQSDGRWDVALRDLDDALALDADGNGELTWGEVAAREADIVAYALARLAVSTPLGPCAVRAGALELAAHADGAYATLPLALGCPAGATELTVGYSLFFDRDPQHRGLLRAEGGELAVLSPARPTRTLRFAGVDALATLAAFVREGAHHVAGGIDHVLFLLALLLPSVLRRDRRGWAPAAGLRPALANVVRVVTAFTLGHSLTLSLAVLGLARMPARLVETSIAASVAVAAAANLRPLFGDGRWVVALALGLLHGFGFSSALTDLGLGGGRLAPALLGFNLGVELGQLALVSLFVPAAYLARRTAAYRRLVLVGGSAAIAVVAVVWSVERALGLTLWS
ncbi:MAG TPA: HupE/UreJ family protein [Haliangiales bacterium]|nr:HupE/UreJ family protein [Haliangiales bacterium]